MAARTGWMTVAGALALLGPTPGNAGDLGDQAAEVARLRVEVDRRAAELERRRTQLADEERALAARRAALAAEVGAEELRLRRLEGLLADARAAAEAGRSTELALGPAVRAAIAPVRDVVRRGIPFRARERVAELDLLEAGLERGTLAASDAASRLLALVEDELELAKTSGVQRQTIALDGAEVYADVARVGMVALYFRTPDRRYGFAERSAGGWRFVRESDEAAIEQIERLFRGLEAQGRSGFYALPGGLAAEEG